MSILRVVRRWIALVLMGAVLAGCGGGAADPSASLGTLLKAATPEPQTGIWWNPSESGRGFAVERQGAIVTLGAYMYEPDGRPVWYVGPLNRQASGSYTGTVSRYSGGQTLTGSYRPPTGSTAIATVTFTLSTATSGTLQFVTTAGVTTIPVQRFGLNNGAVAASSAGFESGLWWNDAESGRGFFIDVQGSAAAMASYMYDSNGAPIWYLTLGTVSGDRFSGQMQGYEGGQPLGSGHQTPQLSTPAGTVTVLGLTGTTVTLTLPGSAPVSLKRLVFTSASSTGKLEGVYEGTVVNGTETARVTILALDNDDLWVAYGAGSGALTTLEGFVLVSGASGNGTYISSRFSDMGSQDGVKSGTVSGTYEPGVSLAAEFRVTGEGGVGFVSTTVVPTTRYTYSQPATLAAISGSWPYQAPGGQTGTFTVSAAGDLGGVYDHCVLAGKVTPRAGGKNVFDVTVAITASTTAQPCNFTGTGVAYPMTSASGAAQLWLGFMNSARDDGGFMLGQR
ncbi:hypothetical protein [Ramlibacter sp.]|uniref:hypothetical protein n=1 Tax=Ramlibacter sp. TaxID=1917967 RepID=UPI0035AE1557